jgi:hypothetical protein
MHVPVLINARHQLPDKADGLIPIRISRLNQGES